MADERRSAPPGLPYRLVIAPDLAKLSDARELARQVGESAHLSKERVFDLQVVLSEACANAIEHAASEVEVVAHVLPDRVIVEITNDGVFQPGLYKDDASRRRGLGLPLMVSLADQVHVARLSESKTQVVITFFLGGRRDSAEAWPPVSYWAPQAAAAALAPDAASTAQETPGGAAAGPEFGSRAVPLEQALRESEGRYRSLVDLSPDAILVYADGRFVFANSAAAHLFGAGSPSALLAEDVLGLVHPDDRARVSQGIGQAYGGDVMPPSEVKVLRLDGVSVDVEVVGVRVRLGGWLAIQLVLRDVSERQRGEAALRESEEHFRLLHDSMLQGVVYHDAEGAMLSLNPAAERILGKGAKDLLGSTAADVEHDTFHEDGSPFPGREHPAMIALSTGKPVRDVLMRVYNPREARYRLINVQAIPLCRPGEARPSRGYTVFDDVTERRHAEEALRESERRFSLIFEKVGLPVALTRHTDGTLADVNEQWVKTFGYSREEAIGKTTVELGLTRDLEERARVIEQLRRAGFIRDRETAATTKSGETRMVTQNIDLVDIGGTRYALTTVYDITERKRAEETLRRHTSVVEGISRILEAALATAAEEDLGGVCLQVAEEITGSKFGFVGELGLNGHLYGITISDPGWDACRIENVPGHGSTVGSFAIHGIYGRVLQDGKGLFTNDPPGHPDSIGLPADHPPLTAFLGAPLKREGQTIGMIAVANREGGYGPEQLEALEALSPAVVEAFARKRAEKETRRLLTDVQTERERLARLIDGISDEVWFADTDGTMSLANPAARRRVRAYEAAGLGFEELERQLEVFRPDMSPCPAEEGPLLRALRGEDVRDHEEIVRAPGSEELRHRLVNASPVRDAAGAIMGSVGVVRDVTDQKRAEEEREQLLFQEQELGEELATSNEELRVQAEELGAQGEKLQAQNAELTALYGRLEQDYQFSQALIHANESVSSTLDIDQILRRIVLEGASALGASTAMLEVREGDSWTVREVFGLPESLRGEALEEGEAPLASLVALSGEPVLVDDAALDGRVGSAAFSRLRLKSVLVVPLVVRGEVVGAGVFTHTTEAGHFGKVHLDFARSLAASAALALENARLFSELQLVSNGQELEARLNGSLSGLAALSTAKLEEEHILRATMEGAMVAVYADSATLLKAEAKGWKVQLVAGEANGNVSEWEELGAADQWRVMSEKLPLVRAHDVPGNEGSAPKTALLIPLTAGREVEWLLELGYRETPRLTRAHLDWARKLSFTISLALQNAKLYQDQRALSLHLQQALLSPPQKVRGVSLGHAYESATANVEVGGDFYDFFSLSPGRVAIVIGDVSGKGVDAAILASLIKNGLRAYLAEEENVATAAAKVNRLFIRDSPMASFATLFCGILDPGSGDLRYLLAGHPPGVVRRRKDGEIVWLAVTSPVVGMFEDALYEEEEFHLAVGDLLLLYTDGIMEARQDSAMFGEEGIAQFVRKSHALSTRELPAKLLQAVLSYTGGQLADDAAILSIRRKRGPLVEGAGDARSAAGGRLQGTAADSPT